MVTVLSLLGAVLCGAGVCGAGGCDAGGCAVGGCDVGGCDVGGCDVGGCDAGVWAVTATVAHAAIAAHKLVLIVFFMQPPARATCNREAAPYCPAAR